MLCECSARWRLIVSVFVYVCVPIRSECSERAGAWSGFLSMFVIVFVFVCLFFFVLCECSARWRLIVSVFVYVCLLVRSERSERAGWSGFKK